MKNLIFTMFLVLFFFSLETNAQTTSIPDPDFEQALIDLGHDSGAIDGLVITANISSLAALNVGNRGISSLTGIEDFTSLEILKCDSNNITGLDLSLNTELTEVLCYNNQLTSLNLTGLASLKDLIVKWNYLSSLDVSSNIVLRNLSARNNNLSCIQVNQTQLDGLNSSDFNYAGWYSDNGNSYSLNCSSLAVNRVDEIQYILFPNPTSSVLNIKGVTSDVSISIYDILGKELVSRKTAKQIDINFLKKGIYFINISDGIKTSVRKFIKN